MIPASAQILPLSGNRFALVDGDDYPILSAFRWRLIGGRDQKFYVATTLDGSTVRLHRMLLNPDTHQVVDHINGDPLDNRRANLRVCTQSENTKNRAKSALPSTSKFKGVHKTKRSKKPWTAQIRVNGRMKYIGIFESEESAARAYDDAAKQHFGRFAKTNF